MSLPIPVEGDPHKLGYLHPSGLDLAELASDLTRGRLDGTTEVHLDPDLDASTVGRAANWRPAFGQVAAAQSHLTNQGVTCGDLFLFFGWFRKVERGGGRWRYVEAEPHIHALFGWLQIAEVVVVSTNAHAVCQSHPWLATHPHVVGAGSYQSSNNTIYVGAESLTLTGMTRTLRGAGVFQRFVPHLQLTAVGRTRSWWRLPSWFMPVQGRPALSYHSQPERWTLEGATTVVRLVDKGQEFVLDCDSYPESHGWIASLFAAER